MYSHYWHTKIDIMHSSTIFLHTIFLNYCPVKDLGVTFLMWWVIKRYVSLSITSSLGSNTASEMLTTPGFWLLNTDKTVAVSNPKFIQKWSRPLGNTNTSPSLRIFRNGWFCVSMNPASTMPLLTKNISEALGWEWSLTKPLTLKSVLAIERPRVFRPANSAAVTRVTEEPKKLSVSPGWVSLEVLKSGALMLFGFLQGKPLMKMACVPSGDVGHVFWRLSWSAEQSLV